MAEKKKKPSPKQLAELQDLYQTLESDVGISQVDEKLLQKFEQGELSKTDAQKLSTELKDVLEKRPSPSVPVQFRQEFPSSGAQFGTAETGYQLKTPIAPERALATTPGQAVLPATLTPEVVAGRARPALPPGQPGVVEAEVISAPDYGAGKGQRTEMPGQPGVPRSGVTQFDAQGRPISTAVVPFERPGPLAVRTAESTAGEAAIKNAVQVAEKNPMLKRLMFPLLAVAGVGAATYSTISMQDAGEKPSTPPVPPGPGPTPPAPAPGPTPPAAPAGPEIQRAPTINYNKFTNAFDGIAKRYEQDRKLAPEVEQAFAARQDALQTALSDAKSVYEQTTAKARSEADRREAITRWASIAESLGQAMVKYFAAREGARTGTLLGSKLQFQQYNWQQDLDRSLERLKADTAEAKTVLGIAREDVEAQAKQLGEERKTAISEREAVARQRAGTAEDVLKEQMRAEARTVEDYIAAQNRLRMEQEQQKQRETKETGKQEAEKQKTFARLSGALASLEKKDTPQARKQLEEAATLLEIPPDEIDELVSETTGTGMFNLAEPKRVQAILEKYRPGAGTAPAQTAGQSTLPVGTVRGGYRFKGGNPADQNNWEKI